ncbi:MAG: Lrp/AsnC family transcriptional regulator [Sporomusaceae bacterium]|nr:Lrp/AsnC family transcriptional regulator [Sporomusaceae bacterium]
MKELLDLLEKDYTLSPEQLSIMLNIPAGEIAGLIKKFEREQVIVKYQTIIDWEKAGIDRVTAVIEVKITPQREVGFDAIAERIYRYPEVRSVYLMSGSYDLSVAVEGVSLREVADFVSTKLSTIEGVVSTTTNFMLKKYKYAGVIINDQEEEHRLVVSP